jgi:hypothetical protein
MLGNFHFQNLSTKRTKGHMPHLIVDSKVPRDKTDALISFRVRGNEIASLNADGSLTVEGDAKANRVVSDTYLGSDYKASARYGL